MTIDGWTAPGFEKVREIFEQHFADGLEVGAAFAAYHRGEPVVDLWGGIADESTGRPWAQDTIIVVFSTTKGATAVCANKLIQEGRLDVDAPVTNYWPEFGQAGKENIPVSYLLSHQAGLAWVDEPLSLDDALAWDPMITALEHQAPSWEPGTKHGYHAITYGHLVGEVIRRITGRSVGTYFRDEIGDPLGLDFWIGLPADKEPRVAKLLGGLTTDQSEMEPAEREAMAAFVGPDTVLGKALTAGGAFSEPDLWNSPAFYAAEVPAAGGISDARSIARMYAATVGEVDGIRLLSADQLAAATTQRTSGPNSVLLDMDIQFGLGFMLPSTLIQLGGPHSFGHFGAGGSAGWGDPDGELGFGYVMNRMDIGLAGDQRSYSLITACYDAIS